MTTIEFRCTRCGHTDAKVSRCVRRYDEGREIRWQQFRCKGCGKVWEFREKDEEKSESA